MRYLDDRESKEIEIFSISIFLFFLILKKKFVLVEKVGARIYWN